MFYKEKGEKQKKKYLIAVEEKHSHVALFAGILVFFCTMVAIIIWAQNYHQNGEPPLHYFTALSNILSSIGAAFMIPYAIEGIRKKHLYIPKYIILFQFSGATCVSITMVTALAIILPTQGASAVTGTNFWLHVVTPAATIVLLQCVETRFTITKREALLTLIPFWIYITVYFVMVVVIGEEHGGWADIYMAKAVWPAWVSVILFLILGFAVSAGLRALQRYRVSQTWKRITRYWADDLEEPEILIEAFGLGRYIGAKCDGIELTIPLDILTLMTDRYDVPLNKLVNAYVTGAEHAMSERGIGRTICRATTGEEKSATEK